MMMTRGIFTSEKIAQHGRKGTSNAHAFWRASGSVGSLDDRAWGTMHALIANAPATRINEPNERIE